jgi:hypothetical protein
MSPQSRGSDVYKTSINPTGYGTLFYYIEAWDTHGNVTVAGIVLQRPFYSIQVKECVI